MKAPEKILVFQTAFSGDVILTLPLVQEASRLFPGARIAFVAIPSAAEALRGHPAVREVIPYDKRGGEQGIRGLCRLVRRLREGRFDLALVPHRSLRSALIVRWSGIPRRIGFSKSAARWCFTDIVRYDPAAHEMVRNASLLAPVGMRERDPGMPVLHPSEEDRLAVDEFLTHAGPPSGAGAKGALVAIAPGSVWATKRWPEDSYAALARELEGRGARIVLVGGTADRELCRRIAGTLRTGLVAAGAMDLLRSAELLRRCRVVISNDSAPVHLAAGVGTPVVAIFGPTVPAFGFAPRGPEDVVVELSGLSCRPCAIHGGKRCPIRTFECMRALPPSAVLTRVERFL
jgi:heptosyltransferase-2